MPLKMRSISRSPFSSLKLKTLSAAVLSAVVLSNTYAAGLGKLTVLSSLGQPLRAEIELTSVSPDELSSLIPKLASADAFRQANIDLNPALFSLNFVVEQRGNQPIVRITSTQPINEPFVDMLLELGGSNNRLIREYTFLLDPPEMRSAQTVQVSPIVTSQPLLSRIQASENRLESVAQPAPRAATPERSAVPARERTASAPKPASSSPDEYLVKKGDSLAKIANQYRPSGVSLDQMLVALYRANPDAFINKNMNRMLAGRILSVPDVDAAKAIPQSDAKGVVVAQAADFNSYRNKLAGQVANAAAKKSDDAKQTAGGKITTRIQEESAAASDSKDKLTLSKSGTALTAGSDKVASAGVSAEELIAKERALADANARVQELEKNVSELQKILEIKNKDLAEHQQQAASVTQVAETPEAVAATAAVTDVAPVPASDLAADAATPDPAAVATEPPAAAVAEAPKKQAVVVVPPPPAPQPSFFEDLTNNAMFLPGAAALLALLAGLGVYRSRRHKQPKSFEDSIITDSSLKSNSLFGSTGGQSVDTNNSVFNSNFVPSASQLDTNEVDPIAEADVYIAYGRDVQAEEILKEALRNQPDRHAVRVKLLEIYANRNDVRSFEIMASELYGMTKGEGGDWAQAANLGLILDPGNPLYATRSEAEELSSSVSALTAETQPFSSANEVEFVTAPEVSYSDSVALPDEAGKLLADAGSPAVIEDLDFDLDGLDVDSADEKSPESIAAPAEMSVDIADINFDFLDDKSAAPALEKSVAESIATEQKQELAASFAAPDIPAADEMSLDFPMSDTPVAKAPEFDLSDITLDLNPLETSLSADTETSLDLDTLIDEESYTSNAEMATKLDLAIAYQEIGDREGARELLEEVVKGGDTQQSEKAKNLLSKLS